MSENLPSQIIVRQEKSGWLKRSFSFLHNETLMATLMYDKSYSNKAHASISGNEFLIHRRGFWKHYLEITSSLPTPNKTQVDLNWRGGLTIKDSKGESYVFKTTGFWKPRWKWFDRHERTLIEIRSNQFSKKTRGTIEIKYAELQDTLFWIVISWFTIVCAESDAAAVAVT